MWHNYKIINDGGIHGLKMMVEFYFCVYLSKNDIAHKREKLPYESLIRGWTEYLPHLYYIFFYN